MNLYAVRYYDNSYLIIVRASNWKEAGEKSLKYIAKKYQISPNTIDDLDISVADEDEIIE